MGQQVFKANQQQENFKVNRKGVERQCKWRGKSTKQFKKLVN